MFQRQRTHNDYFQQEDLVAPYRAILRYYRCDTPYRAILFWGGEHSPKMVRYPPWYLVSHKHICAIPHFATYRAMIVRYPIKTSTKEVCDTIARSIARYEEYRCWASKQEDRMVGESVGRHIGDNKVLSFAAETLGGRGAQHNQFQDGVIKCLGLLSTHCSRKPQEMADRCSSPSALSTKL